LTSAAGIRTCSFAKDGQFIFRGQKAVREPKADDLIQAELNKYNRQLGQYFSADAIVVRSPIRFGLDDIIRREVESLRQNQGKRPDSLVVIIETNGGFIEVVERIYNVFRKHYDNVKFIVPNYAYSAGTVLVLSGDEIYMDYYSVLGPIDPQMESENDHFVSGLGYLAKYDELVKKINSANDAESVRAELAYLLKKFDPAELFDLEQAREHSQDLLETWLSTHKFKDWVETETRKVPVTEEHRRERAKQIAKILGTPERWHSHGRGIGRKELISDEIKLRIKDFGEEPELNEMVRTYYGYLVDYCKKLGVYTPDSTVLHTRNGIRRR